MTLKRIIATLLLFVSLANITACSMVLTTSIAISNSIGWLYFLFDEEDGSLKSGDEIIKDGFNYVKDNSTAVLTEYFTSVIDKKEVKVLGLSFNVPTIKVEKVFQQFTLDPYEFVANYGAIITSKIPGGATDEEIRAIVKEQYTEENIKKFAKDEENLSGSFLIETEVYVYTTADGKTVSETQAQQIETQNELDREKLDSLKNSLVSTETLEAELGILTTELEELSSELEILNEERSSLTQSQIQAGMSNNMVLYNQIGTQITNKQSEITAKELEISDKETEITEKEAEITEVTNTAATIETLETKIANNTLSLTVEIEYAQNPNYETANNYDRESINATIEILKAIVNGG